MKTTSTGAGARRMSPEERDHSILDGAIGLARESGLESLTVRAVAARVGVTPALVAHYRPGMDAFVADVFGLIVAAERDEVIAAFDGADGPAALRAGLLRLIETLLDADRDDVTLIWVQAWALGARNEALAARVRQEMDAWQSALEQIFARAAATGAIAAARADMAAWLLLAMVDGMNAHSLVKWAPRDRADLARRALSAVLDTAPLDTAPPDTRSADTRSADSRSDDK
ncbi:TetR family transcriptional regulator C-terminal domain-containing protein [Microbacterium sp. STF-2]|uniref:TetR/AcrR family transcriptional regulator n=1 Tax=unclassified Microbacterium TaxID=2609290 RepID=UPI0026054388|nr:MULTISPECIES: TetR family transcriptional regulator C-terminal domain-containing protein [unclassified Microbacterium]MCV0333991.1 TetR family transcriptional regulator C-terminal domain-containing protein [Microbacterium sp.]MCV0374481.1 TetR family transcriptional regulator C-terminal domain-containing protein [Microbacterium sp.]MCV0389553.1 TetR family transcriptional regulator C-terminal domain-containing protein [Microbacterium sp.]MCV0419087.1 TetR family transcriptional regulator C-t